MGRINTIYIFNNCVIIIHLKQGIKKQNHQTIGMGITDVILNNQY